jgi:hypothetical protein
MIGRATAALGHGGRSGSLRAFASARQCSSRCSPPVIRHSTRTHRERPGLGPAQPAAQEHDRRFAQPDAGGPFRHRPPVVRRRDRRRAGGQRDRRRGAVRDRGHYPGRELAAPSASPGRGRETQGSASVANGPRLRISRCHPSSCCHSCSSTQSIRGRTTRARNGANLAAVVREPFASCTRCVTPSASPRALCHVDRGMHMPPRRFVPVWTSLR